MIRRLLALSFIWLGIRVKPNRFERGVRLVALTGSTADAETFFDKVGAALTLLEEVDRRRFHRVRTELDAIGMLGLGGVPIPDDQQYRDQVGPAAQYEQELRLCLLNYHYVQDPDTEPVHLAASIVHEATHAYLSRKGFGRRAAGVAQRVEARCLTEEIAFLSKVPGQAHLVEWMQNRRGELLSNGS